MLTVPEQIRILLQNPDMKMDYADAYPHAVASEYPSIAVHTQLFDFEAIERQYDEMISWATERFGPPRNGGTDDAVWTHRVDYFRFLDIDHALEFKMRWG